MKALRLILHQNKAHYRKEHSWRNRLTYPLPPASTIIGAIHSICGWKEYHPMDVSIQGKYQSMNNEIHNRHIYQDGTLDDRGLLVKVCNGDIIYGRPIIISEALTHSSSHTKRVDTIVYNEKLLNEYISLKENSDIVKSEKKEKEKFFKDKLTEIKNKKTKLEKNSLEYEEVLKLEKTIKEEHKIVLSNLNNKINDITSEISKYKIVVKTLQNEEVLSNVDLIIYVKTKNESDLDVIINNVNRLEHLGRTEDGVNIIDASLVELSTAKEYCEVNNESEVDSYEDYISYVKLDMVLDKDIYAQTKSGIDMGTVYYVNKDYKIVDDKRIFNRIPTLLVSGYTAIDESNNVWIDTLNNCPNIVTFI